MKITIHRGTKEIGGSCVELSAANSRLVIDLGLPLVDANREPFDSKKIAGKSTQELKEMKVIPSVSGLFDAVHPAPDGVLLSHAHLDHAGLLPYSLPSISIYATKGTSQMMLAGSLFAKQNKLDRARHIEIFDGKPFALGAFKVTPFHVDHSIYGSVAFLIEAEGRTVLYSGDFRNHGRKPGMIRDLVNSLKDKKVDALMVEGTHFGSEKEQGMTEYELEDKIFEMVQSAPALVLAAFSAMDIDRISTLFRVAKKTDRIFVVDVYTAFVLHLIHAAVQIPYPTKANKIRVFYNHFFLRRRNMQKTYGMFHEDRIELPEILSNPDKYLMVFRTSMVDSDFNGQIPERCRCLYGYWKGYLENPDWVKLKKMIAKANGDFLPAHVSGHAYVSDIIKFVKSVNATKVVPIHTFEPKMFQEHFPNTLEVDDGVTIEI